MAWKAFALVNKPALAPPNWLFPIVWTLLYTLMGFCILSYLHIKTPQSTGIGRIRASTHCQFLLVHFLLYLQWYLFSFIWLVLLWLFDFIHNKTILSDLKACKLLIDSLPIVGHICRISQLHYLSMATTSIIPPIRHTHLHFQ